jgi:3-hydroxyisobutyrate dehydrogenase-like beta-hydroxyacid dehydrogenase
MKPIDPGVGWQVGVIGVGNMGGAMAQNLLTKGWRVAVHDIDAVKSQTLQRCGAQVLDHPSQLAAICKTIIIAVVDAEQVAKVLEGDEQSEGLLPKLGAEHTVLLCPTIAPKDVIRFSQAILRQGASVIDAPMSGGPVRALEGRMSLMTACLHETWQKQETLLRALADPVFFMSEKVGDGSKTKLINNLLAGINLVASAELLAMAEKVGLDLATTLKVIESSSGQSWVGSERMGRAISAQGFDPLKLVPLAHMTLLEKDTRMALEMGIDAGYIGPLGSSAVQTFKDACASGLASCDDAAMLAFLRNFKGQVRGGKGH